MMRIPWLLFSAVLCFALMPRLPAFGQEDPSLKKYEVQPFGGLSILRISISIDKAALDAGLTEDLVRSKAEPRLRSSGLEISDKVIVPGGSKAISSIIPCPQIAIEVDGIPQEDGSLVYSVNVQLVELVSLGRDPNITTITDTWSSAQFGTCGANQPSVIMDVIDKDIDDFLDDFAIANPKALIVGQREKGTK